MTEMTERLINIGCSLPPWARAVFCEDFVVIKSWDGRPIVMFAIELLPLKKEFLDQIKEKIKKEEEVFERIFGY